MAGREDNRIFVGGLAWDTTETQLEEAFSRYGKILQSVVMVDRDTGRPRGFGFVTFSDHQAMDDAINDMHGRELDGRVIAVNKAKPKMGGEDPGYEYERDHMSGGSYRGGDRSAGRSDCFKCGRPGHFARECPSDDGGGRFSSHFRLGRSGGHRYVTDRYGDRFEGASYGERDSRYGYGNRDCYNNDRYSERSPLDHESYAGGRYMNREFQNGYGIGRGRGRGYYRGGGGPRGGGERYGRGGPDRYDRGSYRDRPAPYDRPRRGGHQSSYDLY